MSNGDLLRQKHETAVGDTSGEYRVTPENWQTRAEEAERKLAEAREYVEQACHERDASRARAEKAEAEVERLETVIKKSAFDKTSCTPLCLEADRERDERIRVLEEALQSAKRGLADARLLIDLRWSPKKSWSGHWCSNESECADSVDGALEHVRAALNREEDARKEK